jgi:hypothetical protein
MKKYLIAVFIPYLLLQFSGCNSMQKVTKDDFLLTSEYRDLIVKTKDGVVYIFDEGNYSVKNDTIYGMGKSKSMVEYKIIYEQFEGSISINDVDEIRIDKFDIPVTIFMGIVVLAIGIALNGVVEDDMKFGE